MTTLPHTGPSTVSATLAAWLPERDLQTEGGLELEALQRIAVTVGRRPQLWRDAVRHDPSTRHATLVHRSPNLDVWVLCWLDFQDTGLHDHGNSRGAVHVCEGTLTEEVLAVGAAGGLRVLPRERPTGTTFGFGGSHIHGVRHGGTLPATSIHVYSPALLTMGHYEIGADGALERIVRTYEHGSAG